MSGTAEIILNVQVIGDSFKLIARGENKGEFFDRTITKEQAESISFVEESSFKGDSKKAKIAVEALRLGLAYEYDPYFTLSISRIDPLPHQLEAVYDYFLKTPCIRFLLADDPGAGKTIMAGLLTKELKTRGLIKRILIVTPANLTFQWQRELKDKFRENFEVIRGDILRANYGINPWQDKNQVVTSVSWASTVDDANESLLRAHWDLIIVDEVHKMSAADEEHKTYAYQLGEALSDRTDHLLLMTATPHKGDPENKLKALLEENGVFRDVKTKVLIFTEHKDTLDYLAGDGQNGRPVGKLLEWGLTITSIFGGMKIGDRNLPGSRIHAENNFRENKQILVATEAAGEGINLQFCWLMINYDIPWNPIRLEQRMGRIHRYGQEKDCLILNFVATNTREGRVMQKLFEHIKKITASTLEGLAKRELNLSAIVGKTVEARERRLVPEVIEDFFAIAAPYWAINPKMTNQNSHIYKVGKVPRNLWQRGESLEPRFGVLAKEYKTICFDREILKKDTTLEWVTPGHPLFETICEESLEAFARELKKGAVFYDLYRNEPSRLNVFTACIVDGSGQLLHKRIFVIETAMDNSLTLRQPTIFLDINAIEGQTEVPTQNLPDVPELESFLVNNALNEYKITVEQERHRELHTIEKHLELSLTALIHKQNIRLGQLIEMRESGKTFQGIEGQMSQVEQRILELNNRLDDRRNKLTKERQIAITDVKHLGSAWVLPHPERNKPEIKAMRSDSEIEHIAVDAVIAHEEAQGRKVQSVEKDNRGFDLISRAFHPEDPETAINVRFIEVKGRSEVGEVALSDNEYKTAHRLGNDYFLYVVYNCASKCDIHIIQDPARLGWKPIVRIEHYHISSGEVIKNSTGTGGQIQ